MPRDTKTTELVTTPTTQVVALYAEYDSLLDALEAVKVQLKTKSRRDRQVYTALRAQMRDICEALADVHEKIAEFIILPRSDSTWWGEFICWDISVVLFIILVRDKLIPFACC